MANVIVDKYKIDILANAIADKSGEPVTMTLDEMVEAVDGIETGGGGITPTGNIDITSAGTTDVTQYATATVAQGDVYASFNQGYKTVSGARKWTVDAYATVETGDDYGSPGFIEDGYYEYGHSQVFNAIPTGTSVTPTESAQTIGGANTMMEGAVTVNAIPSNYVGSGITQRTSSDLTASGATVTAPSGYYGSNATKTISSGSATASATKGTVSNHSVTVTPSVTRTAGYVTAGTSSGTAVSVSASELVSGSQTLSDNGTYDVTNLAEVVVDVQGGGGGGGMTLLTTYTMGAIATSSTSSVSTGKTITFTGYNDYDVLVVDASVDTPTNNRHTSTVSMIYLTGPIGVETKTTYTMGSNKWNSQLSSIGVGITRQSTTAYGIYAQSPSVSNNTMSIEMYQRYNPSNTGTINGNYTVRVYGLKLYELIGG